MPKRLAGKTCVVTGGGTGIGLGIAVGLAREGCRVAIAGRRQEVVEAACRQFDGEPRLIGHAVDVSDASSVEQLFRWAREQFGPIDILVNSAGVNVPRRSMAELDPADWEAMLKINVTGAYHCMRAVLPDMRAKKDGLVVNISSIAGIRASLLGGVAYTASKFAMTGLGATVGREEAEHGIRVTNIYPGEVETPILANRPVPVSAEHRARILQPDDVAAAVVMVACLPPRAHVTDLVIKPTTQDFA
ncbi:MAG: SDR family oxidoreductase [Planctomycetia bacterium]|nr:SDR family oxidoreductase [Planctomycetia bacterium]